MMNIEKIKETLANNFVGTLASLQGYKVEKPYTDFGVDMTLEKINQLKYNNKVRYFSSGKIISIQLKCTTEKSIKIDDSYLKFNLKSKNYNDLIERCKLKNASSRSYIPLFLILLVLPERKIDWINYQEAGFFFSGKAYWFYPTINLDYTKNKFTEQITIPTSNQVDLDFCSKIFNLVENI